MGRAVRLPARQRILEAQLLVTLAPWAPRRRNRGNILVTGITGYIGSLIAGRLQRDGHSVRGSRGIRSQLPLTYW